MEEKTVAKTESPQPQAPEAPPAPTPGQPPVEPPNAEPASSTEPPIPPADQEPEATAPPPEKGPETPPARKRLTKKQLKILIGAVAAALVVVIILVAVAQGNVFRRLVSDYLNQWSYADNAVGPDGSYLKIDTNPEDQDYDDLNYSEKLLFEKRMVDSMSAIEYVNEKLGFSYAVTEKMHYTTALQGRQEEDNGKYRVSWTYHPDHGLEVLYEKS